MPLEVIEEIRDGFMNFGGMSVLEISHRSKEFQAMLDETGALVAELMNVPKNYHVIFIGGGASMQFAMIPMNLMDKTADYAVTGVWAKKAFAEAKNVGAASLAFSSEGTKFNRVPNPDEIKLHEGSSYLHITTNNTIYGSQYWSFPNAGITPLVADMSSDIMSRRVNVADFALIYAGAQKNLGPAGVTVVIIRDDIAKISYRKIPEILRYSAQAEAASLFNTPPVFAIYTMLLQLRWMKKMGGVATFEKLNPEKAKVIYDVLDRSSFYKSPVEKPSRSLMNITFTLPSEELTTKFIAEAEARGMVGLKGHRSVGGIRASLYNAFPVKGACALAELMKEFERKQ